MDKHLTLQGLSKFFQGLKNVFASKFHNHTTNDISDISTYIHSTLVANDYATNAQITNLMATIETNEPYLPLSGGIVTGLLQVMHTNGILVNDETSTGYGGLQSTRACANDEDNVNTAGYIINVDGSSKFLHRRGNYSTKEDAYLLFDATGYRLYASGTKGEIINSTGSSGEGVVPVFEAIVNNERPTFNGKEIALIEDLEKMKTALINAGINLE